jgi:hypothetical protein
LRFAWFGAPRAVTDVATRRRMRRMMLFLVLMIVGLAMLIR